MAEVDGKSNAMTVEPGENGDLRKARMPAEDRASSFSEKDRSTPAVSDADIFQTGMERADARLEPSEALSSGTFTDVEVLEPALRSSIDKAGTKNSGVILHKAAP